MRYCIHFILGAALAVSAVSASFTASAASPVAPLDAPFGHARFTLNDADPESTVPPLEARNASPLEFGYYLQEILDKASAATKAGDNVKAVRYYRALAKAVPERALGFSRLCQLLEATDQREPAIAACHSALGLQGVVIDDYVRYVHLILAAPGVLAPKDLEEIKAVTTHLKSQPEAKIVGYHLQCELGTRVADVAALEDCTAALAAAAPRDPKTISFQWALALQKGDGAEAGNLIQRATEAGMTAEAVQLMKDRTATRFSLWPRRLTDWRFSAPLAVAVFAAAASALAIVRRRRQLTS
ncbi:MAG: hypothetical protein QOI66_751 [Myxococcales bacterium]|jgi:hypothetical protein|nr:hypothetical protein [Myxococcales bacterium]